MFKWLAVAFALLVISIIVMADRGTLPAAADVVRRTPGGDKIAHFILIGVLALLGELATGGARWRLLGLRIPAASLTIGIIVALEELSQIWIPNRTFSLLDLAADGAGIIILGGLGAWWGGWARRRRRSARESAIGGAGFQPAPGSLSHPPRT